MADIPLDELMAAIGTSVNEAQRIIEQQALGQYCGYFTEKKGGAGEPPQSLVPELLRFVVPTPDGKKVHREVAVPNVTMLPHESLNLETVRVSLAITSCRMEGGKVRVEVDGRGRSSGRASEKRKGAKEAGDDFLVSPSGCQYPFGGRHGSALEMVFRHAPPAEGIRRLNLEQVKIIHGAAPDEEGGRS